MLFSIVANPLLHYFTTLTIKHSLMSHLLVTGVRVIILLVPLGYLLAISAYSSLGLCLVDFGDGLTIWSNLRRFAIGLHLESLTAAAHTT